MQCVVFLLLQFPSIFLYREIAAVPSTFHRPILPKWYGLLVVGTDDIPPPLLMLAVQRTVPRKCLPGGFWRSIPSFLAVISHFQPFSCTTIREKDGLKLQRRINNKVQTVNRYSGELYDETFGQLVRKHWRVTDANTTRNVYSCVKANGLFHGFTCDLWAEHWAGFA